MKEKINSLSNGIFSYDTPTIEDFEHTLIKNIVLGTIQKGSFTIKNHLSSKMKGIIYTSNPLFRILTKTFVGTSSVIEYEVDASYLTIQDTIKGAITIISDCGELQVPYHILVEAPYFDTSVGRVKDLLSFTNLAKVARKEALTIFTSSRFEQYIIPYDQRLKILYHELMKGKNHSHAMEEFLISSKKKLEVSIQVDRTSIQYHGKKETFKDTITVSKEQWGYCRYKITTDCDFIELPKDTLSDEEFVAHNYNLEFLIHPEKVHKGNNNGHIYITGLKQVISIDILCILQTQEEKEYYDRVLRPYQLKLGKNYIDFRTNAISPEDYVNIGRNLIHHMMKEIPLKHSDRISYLLMEIHFDVIGGNLEQAAGTLEHVKQEVFAMKERKPHMYCGYEYLQALVKKDENTVYRSTEIINRMYEEYPEDFRILWYLFYMDKRYDNHLAARLEKLKEHYMLDSRSPILYYEAMEIYNEEPSLFHELSTFELHVCLFAMRKGWITKEIGRKITYYAKTKKVVSQSIMKLLEYVYTQHKEDETLFTICSLLIRTHQLQTKYHKWFALGVSNNLRITELYEYFMYTYSEKKDLIVGDLVLPKQVLLYFSYNSNLGDKKKAYLYAYVIMNKSYLSDIFMAYEERIFEFARKNIMLHNINYHLSIIYDYYLKNHVLEDEIKEELIQVMFRHQIQCNNKEIRGAYIVFDEFEHSTYIPFINGTAQVDLYHSKYQIILVDDGDNYYKSSILYTVDKLFPWEEFIHLYYGYEGENAMVLSNLYDTDIATSAEQIYIRKSLIERGKIKEEATVRNILSFIEYYYQNYDSNYLDYYLNQIHIAQIPAHKRGFVIELFILRGMLEEAIHGINSYGMDGVDISRLIKLCSMLLEELYHSTNSNQLNQALNLASTSVVKYEENFITKLCYYIFKLGKYTVPILEHLIKHYNGSTSDLFTLWECAVGFDLKTSWIEERLLGQMLFSMSLLRNSYSVFERYYTHGSNYELIKAYLSLQSFRYLMEDIDITEELHHIMKKEITFEEQDICILAVLKYNSKQDFLEQRELQFVQYHMNKYVNKGIILPFFYEYKKHIELPTRLVDKTIISHRANPKYKVYINYRLVGSEKVEFKQKEMDLVYLGIFTYGYVLFHGEELEYFITEEYNKEEIYRSERYRISQEFINEGGTYGKLNEILLAIEEQDREKVLGLIEHMGKEKALLKHIYLPI